MSRVHFRCSFDLHAQDAEDSWANLLRTVRKWIAQRPQPQDDDDFWKGWFFKGGVPTKNYIRACEIGS